MRTRSVTRMIEKECQYQNQYPVDIDFDGASIAWRSNKKSTNNGCFVYICEATTKTGNPCKKRPMQGSPFCSIHKIE